MIEAIRARIAQLLQRIDDAHVRAQLHDAFGAIERMALSDPLTGCANRVYLAQWWRSVAQDVHIMLIDIDHFKAVNDRYGYVAGDVVLRTVATRWMEQHRDCVFVRYGGDEFLCIDPLLRTDIVAGLCADVADNPIVIAPQCVVSLTVSVGVMRVQRSVRAEVPLDGVLHALDSVLQQAKKSGRNRCVWADAMGVP